MQRRTIDSQGSGNVWRDAERHSMTISHDIAPLLPDLRRFSRALSGSQESGDAFVMATLQRLLESHARFPRDIPPRIAPFSTSGQPSGLLSPPRTATLAPSTAILPRLVPKSAKLSC